MFSKTNTLKIPSSKDLIKYRPYTVGEEKDILLIDASTSRRERLGKIKNVIKNCVDNKLDFDKMTIAEIMYIFTAIRIKSAGEETTIDLPCPICSLRYDKLEKKFTRLQDELRRMIEEDDVDDEEFTTKYQQKKREAEEVKKKALDAYSKIHTQVVVDLNKLELDVAGDGKNTIDFRKQYGFMIELNHSYKDLFVDDELQTVEDGTLSVEEKSNRIKELTIKLHEHSLEQIRTSIEKIFYDDGNIIDKGDKKEVEEFISSMPSPVKKKIMDVINTPPSLIYKIEADCSTCGYHFEEELKDDSDFLSF